MALSTATISYNLADMVGSDFDASDTRVWVTTNVEGGAVIDTVGNAVRLGDGAGSLAADGTGSLNVWVPGAGSNPASWQTTVHVMYSPRINGWRPIQRDFGPFTVTANADLADLVAEQEVPPTYLSTVTGLLDGYVDDAQAAQAAATASAAAAQALVLSDLGTTDGQTKALIQNPASQTSGALAATFVPQWKPATPYSADQIVVAPGGAIVERINAGTSGSTYASDQWRTATSFLRELRKRVGEKGQFFNITGPSMRRFRAAQARAAKGGAPVTIVLCADSIGQSTAGSPFSTNGWFARFQAMVERREGANSQHFTFMDLPGQDDRYSQTGTWTRLANKGWVGGQARTSIVAGSTTTLNGTGTRFSLRYLMTTDGGDFTYSVDGAAAVNVATNGAEGIGEVALTLAAGPHVVVVTKASDTTRLTLIDAEFRISATGGYRFIKAAMTGQKIGNFTSSSYGNTPGAPIEILKATAPDLVIGALETNDWGNGPTSVTSYKASTKTLIDAAQISGDYLLVCTVPPKEPAISPADTSIEPYNDALYDLAVEEACGLVDMQARWGSYAEAFAAGMMNVESSPFYHPSDQGNWDYAKAIFEAVFGQWGGRSPVALDAANTWLATQIIGHPTAGAARVRIGSTDIIGGADWATTPAFAGVLATTAGGLLLQGKSGQKIWQWSSVITKAGTTTTGENANTPATNFDGFIKVKVFANLAAMPTASIAGAGSVAFVTGQGMAYSDGTTWKRISTDAAIT